MENIKSIYIKAPKKTLNNKKLIIKKNSLKKINEISNNTHKNVYGNLDLTNKSVDKTNSVSKDLNKLYNHKKISISNLDKTINRKKKCKLNDFIKKDKKIFDKKSYSRRKIFHKRLNSRKNCTKKKERYVRLIIDSNNEIKGRLESKKKFKNNLMKLSRKKIKKALITKGLIKKDSRAPIKLLTDIYLNSKLMGDINVIKN